MSWPASLLAVILASLLTPSAQSLPAVPYESRPGPAQSVPDALPLSVATRILGLPALDQVMLPRGSLEIRIGDNWTGNGYVPVLRLVELEGREAAGQLLWVGQGAAPGATCGTPEPYDYPLCVIEARFPEPPDWSGLARQLETLGVWSVAPPCEELPRLSRRAVIHPDGRIGIETLVRPMATHTRLLDMVRLEGETFSALRCYEESGGTRTIDGAYATAIYGLFRELVRAASYPDPAELGG